MISQYKRVRKGNDVRGKFRRLRLESEKRLGFKESIKATSPRHIPTGAKEDG